MNVLRVALDVPTDKVFDYVAGEANAAQPGDRVAVPFGKRSKIGVVLEAGAASELGASRLKPIERVLDDAPRLPADWLEQMRFLAAYYQRPLGETVASALPPRLRSGKPPPKERSPSPLAEAGRRFVSGHAPNAAQAEAIARIGAALGRFRAFLLHGVTGSGKTEVYLQLVAQVIARGNQALVLVPEIGLTPQLEARFRAAFPETGIAVLHSALEDGARTRAWLAAARGEASIVLGTRLAVLTPLPRLAIVIVDEEHDASFKQQEGLRYSGRDAAVQRAKLAGCPVVLGSATPSLETWHNSAAGRYERITLPARAVPGAKLPSVRTIDLRTAPVENGLAAPVLEAIKARLARGEQSLVFLNRRGYAPVLACEACGWAASCARCSAHLVLHSPGPRLLCHHCGATERVPRECPTCGNVDLRPLGRGTQRIEETLEALFPAARVVRIDRDSARRRDELARKLEDIRRGEAEILVGTQLLAKGHDFPSLTLVCVLNADTALLSTDFRSAERLFATLAQVGGRSGRREQPGEMLVQTRYPGHPLFGALARHDYAGFAEGQLAERKAAGFPPFVHEAALRAEARKLDLTMDFLRSAALLVPAPEGITLYDPVPHVITKRAGYERAQLLVQSPSRPVLQEFLRAWSARLAESAPRSIRWHLDVDPIEFD
ncbi:MAG TPA: primosomal protein N' [Burkholderiales bacterium]|jgi:primosomal protein N' (replication factor Y)|nr:primosomal protein N' [Burkholderiales bacterium]